MGVWGFRVLKGCLQGSLTGFPRLLTRFLKGCPKLRFKTLALRMFLRHLRKGFGLYGDCLSEVSEASPFGALGFRVSDLGSKALEVRL